jgi:protein phosphatase
LDSPAIHSACATHTGRIRDRNEDSYLAQPEQGLWLIADGMGGHQGGEIASSLVVHEVHKLMHQDLSLRLAINMTHQTVKTAAGASDATKGMGSTVVALKLDRFRYEVCWVGDSRAYLWDDISLEQLTRDHSFVRELVDSGIITDVEARQHPRRNVITRALGLEPVENLIVDCVSGDLFRGERILLCSDGLTSELNDTEISEILALGNSCQATVDLLVQNANARGGRDNITAILVEAPANAPVKRVRNTQKDENRVSPARGPWWSTIRYRLLGLVVALAALLLAVVFFGSSEKNAADKSTVHLQDSAQDSVRIKKSYVPLDDHEASEQNNRKP